MLIPVSRGSFFPLLLASLVVGLFLGVVYDVLRIRRAAFRLAVGRPQEGKGFRVFIRRHLWGIDCLLCLFEDVLFLLLGTVVFILTNFKLAYGIPRWYAYGAALAGFLLYRVTIGRLVMGISEGIIRAMVWACRFLRHRLLRPTVRAVARRMAAWRDIRRAKKALANTEAWERAALSALEGLGRL
jgi:hypothetical protein